MNSVNNPTLSFFQHCLWKIFHPYEFNCLDLSLSLEAISGWSGTDWTTGYRLLTTLPAIDSTEDPFHKSRQWHTTFPYTRFFQIKFKNRFTTLRFRFAIIIIFVGGVRSTRSIIFTAWFLTVNCIFQWQFILPIVHPERRDGCVAAKLLKVRQTTWRNGDNHDKPMNKRKWSLSKRVLSEFNAKQDKKESTTSMTTTLTQTRGQRFQCMVPNES